MKPIRTQYFFAQEWPLKIWFAVIVLLCVAAAVRLCEPTLTVLGDWRTVLWLGLVVLLALPVGWFTAILSGPFVLYPIYYCHSVFSNSAPFHPGDRVRILVGPHRDRIARVYSPWQGNSVRVELGEKEKEGFEDIFCPHQLLREHNAELDAAPDPAAR